MVKVKNKLKEKRKKTESYSMMTPKKYSFKLKERLKKMSCYLI